MDHGHHLIAGQPVGGPDSFANQPVEGTPDRFAVGTAAHVAMAADAAEAAFADYAARPRAARAAFLRRIADGIEARGPALTATAMRETGLPAGRLEGERGRTIGQLRLFAELIEGTDWLDLRHDPALPDRAPLPRPDLRMMQRPVGPVAVFGASNFPLAFSTAGGDTASALAAGCPVVVKGHEAHPATSAIVAGAIAGAAEAEGMPAGVFSLVQGGSRETGAALVTHPSIRAVGFTGSLAGGRALFDLCARRPEPIPFFGELGSTNPVFVLPGALAARGAAIAAGWAASLTMGAGQFCTNPGILVLPAGPAAEAFLAAARTALAATAPQTMLTDGICGAFARGAARIAGTAGVAEVLAPVAEARRVTPGLWRATVPVWRAAEALGEEVFGPAAIVLTAADAAEMRAVAESLHGQLTATLQVEPGDEGDMAAARMLLPVLERKAGRILANGFPTGVEVAAAMVHGGPYPASTNFGATSVGTLSIRRWLRAVCWQAMPEALLPEELRGL